VSALIGMALLIAARRRRGRAGLGAAVLALADRTGPCEPVSIAHGQMA
jgi:hypothetical protein